MTVAARRAVRQRPDQRHARQRAASRQRQWRQRQKKCQASYRVDADGAVLDMLIRRKYLDEIEADDARQVGAAIALFMADHAALDEP